MIVKTEAERASLRTGGALLRDVLEGLSVLAQKPGVTTADLDLEAERLIRAGGGIPAFLNYQPGGAAYPFPATLCISVNEEVVHGIPREDRVLKTGDLVTLDCGLSYNGLFVDAARTVCVGNKPSPRDAELMNATRVALEEGIAAVHAGATLGDIGAAISAVAREHKLGIAEDLGGHSLGKCPHERPYVENIGRPGHGAKLEEGLILALEPIFTEGKGKIELAPDQWTYLTRDGSRSAHEEDTIIVTKDGAEVLTR